MFSSEHDLLDKINNFTIQRNESCNVSHRKELNRELVGLRRELKNLRCNPVLPVTKPERNTVTTIFDIYRKIKAFLEGEQPYIIIERESLLLIKEHLARVPFSGTYRAEGYSRDEALGLACIGNNIAKSIVVKEKENKRY